MLRIKGQYSRVSELIKIMFPRVIEEGILETMGIPRLKELGVNGPRELEQAFQMGKK